MKKDEFLKVYGKSPTKGEMAQVVRSYHPNRLKWTQGEWDRLRKRYKRLIRWN